MNELIGRYGFREVNNYEKKRMMDNLMKENEPKMELPMEEKIPIIDLSLLSDSDDDNDTHKINIPTREHS